jgi:hypothetical protein
MKLNAQTQAEVLKTFIQEDRSETRIYRGRIQTVSNAVALASFAISAFLIGNVHSPATQLRNMTLLIDPGLIAVMWIFFFRTKRDLRFLRKAMKGRQELLKSLQEGEVRDIDPFLPWDHVDADIKDNDLYWVTGLSTAVVIVKMLVLALMTSSFVVAR